ncbi:MAG: hypothetical protein AB7F91_12485 [Parvularculaceae bacterium]|nr:hypothetical protein [Parvularculaceae bacterium]
MTAAPKMAIWKRAAIRGGGAAALLFVSLEGLILLGKTAKLDTAEALFISLASGAAYAGLWTVFAAVVERMLARVNEAAKGDEP